MGVVRAGMVGLVALISTGCATSVSAFDMPDAFWGSGLEQARIAGHVGRFEADVREGYGWAEVWDRGVFIDVRGRGESGIVMAMIDLSNVDVAKLTAGDRFVGGMQLDADGAWQADQPWLMMQGCGGEIDDIWEEDYPAESVEVEVVEVDDGDVVLDFEAVLEFTQQHVDGRVRIPVL